MSTETGGGGGCGSSSLIDLRLVVSACVSVAEKAADLARSLVLQNEDLEVRQKTGPKDLLTIVDLKVQALIIGSLLNVWPNLNIVGEEQVAPQTVTQKLDLTLLDNANIKINTLYPIDDITLYVDPIDGTKEFTEGIFSNVCILIGIALKSTPIAGVVHSPWKEDRKDSPKGLFLWGLVDHGISSVNKDIVFPPPRDHPESELVVTVTRIHTNPQLEEDIKKLQPHRVLRVGGCGHKALLVLQGVADVYFFKSSGTSKWDTCAVEALLSCVGGKLTDFAGNRIDYSRDQPLPNPGFLVTLRNHDEFRTKLL